MRYELWREKISWACVLINLRVSSEFEGKVLFQIQRLPFANSSFTIKHYHTVPEVCLLHIQKHYNIHLFAMTRVKAG
jgi:hypothetical protein